MALSKVRTEMKGTGGGRYTTRADAKTSAKKRRRRADKAEAAPRLTRAMIEAALRQGAKSADELNKMLEECFTLSPASASLVLK
jgi:hypothetical protein